MPPGLLCRPALLPGVLAALAVSLACGVTLLLPAAAVADPPVVVTGPSPPPQALASWSDIDALRSSLEASGSRVVQRDCGRRGLQGLYHQPSGTIVVCRVHRDPQGVWNTLAHEATHRMQACAGGPITRASHREGMARALAVWAPQELRSLQAYPAGQQLAELEARYTARLAPAQVLQLFRRYCGAGAGNALSQRP